MIVDVLLAPSFPRCSLLSAQPAELGCPPLGALLVHERAVPFGMLLTYCPTRLRFAAAAYT
jgi:hypothetical protein